ncbi:MAG: hypothetical protein A2Y38_06385 [Spirochaetes bacterium GWB1_59_5]|nr:MAG: hypothetical protein A2Y38_06385 [Spirochaetes bacterium GWB1_59_5]
MKKGNKSQRHEKAKAKRSLQQTRRAAARPVPPPSKKLPKPPTSSAERTKLLAEMARDFKDPDYLRWIAAGVNYIVSDYEAGRWETLFDDIYQEGVPEAPPAPEGIAQRVVLHFGEPTMGTYEDLLMKVCIGWTVMPRESHYIYWREARRRLLTDNPNVDLATAMQAAPNAVVWLLLHEVKQYLLSRV